jgi:TM2 domain-containing membrane protein YozV
MNKLLLIIFISVCNHYPQAVDSTFNLLHQKENIIKFADYLFCQKDYLRSLNEYRRLREEDRDEKINFKMALNMSTIGDYSGAMSIISETKKSSPYYKSSRLEMMKIFFYEEKYSDLRKHFQVDDNSISKNELSEMKLYFISFLKDNEKIPSFNDFIKPFDITEHDEITTLYQMKINPPSKSPAIASILSAVIPGAGKIYTGEISDGIFSLITTGLFSFLAYDNFKADHDFRGWLFSGLATMFYGGNIYGSYASAQIYNARIKYEFNVSVDSFLKSKNYFFPQYDFCK